MTAPDEALAVIQDHLSRGFQLVFYPPRQKGPEGVDAVGWQRREYTLADYRPGDNVGVKLGTEIAPFS